MAIFLGFGAGGVYPLAAVLSAEQGPSSSRQEQEEEDEPYAQLHRVVITFSMQGVGFLAVPVLAVPLLHLTSNLNVVWRLLLGFGSVPGIVLMLLQRRLYGSMRREALPLEEPSDSEEALPPTEESQTQTASAEEPLTQHEEDFVSIPQEPQPPSSGIWESIKKEPDLAQKMVGTAGTWFLFDVLFYGNTLFQPIVMEAAFGGKNDDDTLKKAATDSLILALIALPGYLVSALVMGKRTCHVLQTPRFVQLQGFALMTILYAIIGAYWSDLKRVPALLVTIYGATFFFANYGPNTTTFVFPSLVYSPDCRSTLNGISAAAGKLGALSGSILFEPAARDLGDDKVMLICAAVSVIAFATTSCFVAVPSSPHHHEATD